VEHEHLVAEFRETGASGVDRWRRHPEHGRGDERALLAFGARFAADGGQRTVQRGETMMKG
jgi:hypothetical protein